MRCDLAALKPTTAPFPTLNARKLVRRRLFAGDKCGCADFRLEVMLRECRLDPRNQILPIGLVIDVLELAPAAFREVTAWR